MCPCNMVGQWWTIFLQTNVMGKRCNTCKEGTFGLDMENPDGCTRCFCFGRSDKCIEAGYTWDQERANDRILTLRYEEQVHQVKTVFFTWRDFPNCSNVFWFKGLTSNDINALKEIPSTYTDVEMEPSNESPLYWKLPASFTGDLVLSYGGYLRFETQTFGSKFVSPDFVRHYPIVHIQGKETSLESYSLNQNEIKLHELYWRDRNKPVTREQFMVILQNVTKILIKATESVYFTNATYVRHFATLLVWSNNIYLYLYKTNCYYCISVFCCGRLATGQIVA